MTRLFDRRNQREVIPAGAYANAFVTYEDKPLAFDAWDIDIFHQDKPQGVTDLVDAAVVEAGPERGVIRFVWRVAQSTISQRVVFLARDPRIDFVTEVDWQHRQTLLTVQFPVLVRSTRATFAIQFGNVERPTHANTSWDWARFETCAHQWADLSEAGYGVTLLNDSKYGHQVRGNVMRLTLLKSAIMPDPEADRGHHAFTYALLPHAGSLHEAGAVSQGARLNLPVQVVAVRAANGAPGGAGRRDADDGPNGSFVRCDAPHVVVETVKSAEPDGVGSEARSDGSLARGTVTVRAYDVEGRRGRARLTFARPVVRAWSANLLERVATPLACEGASVTVEIAPFAVVTVVAMLA